MTGFITTNGTNPTVEFDGQVLSGLGSSDLFVAKYDAGGTLQWIRRDGGSMADEGRGIVLTSSGEVVVSGSFQGTAVFGGDTLVSEGLSDVLLVSYDANGNVLWAQRYGGAGDDRANKLAALPGGDVVAVGDLQASVDFGGTVLTAAGLGDAFVARFDAMGSAVWAVRAGSAATFAVDQAFDVVPDANGDLLVCGEITGPSDIGGITLVPNGGIDLFIARFDGAGSVLWAHHAGGPQTDHAYGIAVDPLGNAYVTGQADAGASTVFDTITLDPFGNEAVFLARYDASGAVQWVERYAPGSGGAVEVDPEECLYITGGASGIVGQPAFDAIAWQYVDRAIFTARYCAAVSTQVPSVVAADDPWMHPNPAHEALTLHVPGAVLNAPVLLVDELGCAHHHWTCTGPAMRIDLAAVQSGYYTVLVPTASGPVAGRLLVLH